MTDIFLPFSVAVGIIFLGFIGDVLFDRWGIPDTPLLILLGVIFGPILQVFPREGLLSIAPILGTLTLVMILFGGGMNMSLERIIKQSSRATILSLIYLVTCSITISLLSQYFLNLDFLEALLLGVMATGTSSVVVIPLMAKLNLDPDTSLTLSIESTLTDILDIVLVVAILHIYLGRSIGPREALISLSSSFSVGIVIGFILGVIWLKVLFTLRKHKFTYMLTVAAVILTYVMSEYLGGSGAMSTLLFGLVIGNDKDIATFMRMSISNDDLFGIKGILVKFQEELSFLMRSFFFVFLGLLFDIYAFPITLAFIYAVFLTLINLLARYFAAYFATFRSPMKQNITTITFICGKGLAPAILSLMPLQYGLPNSNLYITLIATLIILSNLVTAVYASILKRKLT